MKQLHLVALLKDDDIRSATVGCLQSWMFDQEIAKVLHKSLCNSKIYSSSLITADLSTHLDRVEVDTVVGILDKVQTPLLGECRSRAFEMILDFIREKLFAKIVRSINSGESVNDLLPEIEKMTQMSLSGTEVFDFSNPESMVMARKIAFPAGRDHVIKSSFSLINQHTTMNGYTPGTLNMFVARPGCGKTTAMLNEAVGAAIQGFNVLHIFLGDMGPWDVALKYISHYKKITIAELQNNEELLQECLDDETMKTILSRLKVSVHGSYELSVQKLVSIAKTLHRDNGYHFLVIDYDGNIDPAVGDNLYESGGTSYSHLEWLSRQLQVPILIGCQAKIHYWGEEVLPLDSAADSSRKQHAVDMMITMGQSNSNTNIATMNIAKMRRGVDNKQMRVLIDGSVSTIQEIPEDKYQRILSEASADTYSSKKK